MRIYRYVLAALGLVVQFVGHIDTYCVVPGSSKRVRGILVLRYLCPVYRP